MLGEEAWEKFSKAEKKKWRKVFKVVFLAVAYRMSSRTLGQQLNVSEEEAQSYIDGLFNQFPVLEKFILANSEYPINHEGYINTELGDTLRCSAYRYLYETDRNGRKKMSGRVQAKLGSAGINYRIQSFSALSLASGFANTIQEAVKQGLIMKNIIVVHDSCENLFDINHLFEVRKFYDTYFFNYAKSKYGISFNYDLEIGLNYSDMLGVKVLEEGLLEISGTGRNIQSLLWKIQNESDLNVEINVPVESIEENLEQSAIRRFIKEKQCCMIHDDSYYTIQMKKL